MTEPAHAAPTRKKRDMPASAREHWAERKAKAKELLELLEPIRAEISWTISGPNGAKCERRCIVMAEALKRVIARADRELGGDLAGKRGTRRPWANKHTPGQ